MRQRTGTWLAGLAGLALVMTAGGLVQADPLPGTQPLVMEQPLDVVMVDGIDRFALRELAASVERRAALWKRDFSSPEAYEKSITPNRDRLKVYIGAVDPRVPAKGLELIATTQQPAEVAKGAGFTVYQVRWPVLNGVTAEGLWLKPEKAPVARVIALPDADWTPEMLVGLTPGATTQFAKSLASAGIEVLIPTLISRDDTFAGNPEVAMTNQAHREYIYRQAFEMGRHVIGYEVQKVMAAVDQFTLANETEKVDLPIGVAGVGEGGLVALFSAACDPRIDATLVSGYFGPREAVWQEPIYRNVWAQLTEFGDAEIAGLIAPRVLAIDPGKAPEVAGPHPVKPGRRGGAAPGVIKTPARTEVEKEFARAKPVYAGLKAEEKLILMAAKETDEPVSAPTLSGWVAKFAKPVQNPAATVELKDARADFDPQDRQRRQVQELVDFTQRLMRESYKVRDKLWSTADRTNVDTWTKTAQPLRDLVYNEMIGRLPAADMPPNVRTRPVLDEPEYTGYEVVIDLYPDVIAGGILLLPKDLQPGEKRPVVVCQHGLEGVPMDTISKTASGFPYYKAFTAELAKRGFITYAPQNPYRGQDRFRTLQRKSNPLKRSLFSYIIPQHQRTIDFLKTLPNVDPQRIGFYGLSYGGKTAVRVPPMLTDYALSICSADYNEWVMKNATVSAPYSYIFTGEYEIFEWNMGHYANYAELSMLMTPRPFMVERGHTDGVSIDEWVAWEFAKVLRHYDFVGLPGMTEMEVFNGPHTINGKGTYDFLHRHLKWPVK